MRVMNVCVYACVKIYLRCSVICPYCCLFVCLFAVVVYRSEQAEWEGCGSEGDRQVAFSSQA